ncbi:MAG: hypothetical protein ACD_46C00194G0005 [uncultured bacterium]|nr:MAG: hypothetical protein ACD_46C00194G0005 [uncultured bacterium]
MKITDQMNQAVAILRAGGLVAFPTETVYGLGADATNEAAVAKIFAAKNRPKNHPLIVHLASLEQVFDWAFDVSPQAKKLAKSFWPGPLTMIFKKKNHVLDALTGGQNTIGLRIPRHPIAQQLLQQFGGGIAAPSANQFTHLSPTTAEDVREELGQKVDLILDGGVCDVGVESTIIDMTNTEKPRILRPGMINKTMLEAVLHEPILTQNNTEIRAPGTHHLHYAPTTKTELIAPEDIQKWVSEREKNSLPMVILTRQKQLISVKNKPIAFIVMPSSATQYAHDLYHTLRCLDHQQYERIIIEMVPETAEWDAIRDRLNKASGKKI